LDVDIDTQTSFDPVKLFPSWVRASVVRDGRLTPHPCGVYPQRMPRDPMTKLAAIPHEAAEDFGFLKVDFLHLSLLNPIKSREELEALTKTEPNWSLLQLTSTHPKLFQLSKHGDLLIAIKPKSLEELADCIALIRPGKKQFLGLYLKQRAAARVLLYAKDPESGYSFKRSHSFAYALNIIVQLNLIEQGRL
jgi:DNA polymerase III alpha subunit